MNEPSRPIAWRNQRVVQRHPRESNPLFPKPAPSRRGAWWLLAVGLLGLGAVGALLFVPVFKITYTTVEGNAYFSTSDVERAIETYKQSKFLWLLPRTSFLLFSTKQATESVRKTLQQVQALESLTVTKYFPARVHVALAERTPNLLYKNNGSLYVLDRAGVLTGVVPEGETPHQDFPLLIDQNTRDLAIGRQLFSGDFIDFLFRLRDDLRSTTDIPVDFFYVPPQTCFSVQTVEPVLEVNTNTAIANETNAADDTNGNANVNAQEEGTGEPEQIVEEQRCTDEALLATNHELRAHSTEEWEMYFRTDDDLASQLSRMQFVLETKHLDRGHLSYIDLRFGDAVVYK